ncbi:M23 family metallopeptidase [bacterium]|nr:M23 family metallopeptidase [bacterium]
MAGEAGSRELRWNEGPDADSYSHDDQPSDDPVIANRCGWNARTHMEYEGQPAVDWYVPPGTPVVATMDGIASLSVVTTSNPFDVYGVSREPYLGNPDRARAPISPFPGPGGGQGVFARVENASFVTNYAHFELAPTLDNVPGDAFVNDYGADPSLFAAFVQLRDFRVSTLIAQWPIRAGELLGFSGDTGYSEAPHLHYSVRRQASDVQLCPTTEAGFADSGWLFRSAG